MSYEYRVVPAPKQLRRRKGVSSNAELFATTLAECINAEAQEGWEYVRSESLSAEGPSGWFRRAAIVEETMLIFRRHQTAPAEAGETRETAEAQRRHTLLARRGPIPQERPRHEAPQTSVEARPQTARPAEARPHAARPVEAMPPLLRPVPRNSPGDKT
jgi:hypothetical protein